MRMAAYNQINTHIGKQLGIFLLIIRNLKAVLCTPVWKNNNKISMLSCFLQILCYLVFIKKIYTPRLVIRQCNAICTIGVVKHSKGNAVLFIICYLIIVILISIHAKCNSFLIICKKRKLIFNTAPAHIHCMVSCTVENIKARPYSSLANLPRSIECRIA